MTCSRQAIPYVHVVRMELDLNCLSDDLVHVSGFGGEDLASWRRIQCSLLKLCSATVNISDCLTQVYRWRSLTSSQYRVQPVQCEIGHIPREHCTHPESQDPDHPFWGRWPVSSSDRAQLQQEASHVATSIKVISTKAQYDITNSPQ